MEACFVDRLQRGLRQIETVSVSLPSTNLPTNRPIDRPLAGRPNRLGFPARCV